MIYVEGYGYIEESLYNRIYTEGYGAGIDAENRDYDVAAFDAIRRAAAKARMYEHTAKTCDRCNYPCDYRVYVGQANAIRRAIRAAIGSDKA